VDQLRKIYSQEGQPVFKGTTAESGGDVARLLGLVARIHTYVNRLEKEKGFPGCRTVVASGLRKCFANRKGVDDFFSANFSVSTAFEAEKIGASVGLKDNNLYVEDDVAMAISYCEPCHAILGFSKFIATDSSKINPYSYQCAQEGTILLTRDLYSVPEPIVLDIMKKRLNFRRLDPIVLTNLQLFEDYQRLSMDQKEKGQLEKAICDSLFASTPSIDQVNRGRKFMEYPFLSLKFSLDDDYSEFIQELWGKG
jgi:hypothetical protein